MTLETLQAYGSIISSIKSIRAEKDVLKVYENGQVDSGITDLIHYLECAERDQIAMLKEVEEWFINGDDPEIASLARWHYVVGYPWKKASKEVYGYEDSARARKKVSRYFQKKVRQQ